MARVTVEDCVDKVPNRFDLVLVAGQRSRQISAGEELTIDRDNDKNPVVALREIADTTVDNDELRESVIRGMQRHVEHDEPEEDDMALLMAGQEWSPDATPPAPEVAASSDVTGASDTEEAEASAPDAAGESEKA